MVASGDVSVETSAAMIKDGEALDGVGADGKATADSFEPEIRATGVELLDGTNENSTVVGKGYFDPQASNTTSYILDVNRVGADPRHGVFTIRVNFKIDGGDWVRSDDQGLKVGFRNGEVLASSGGRWKLADDAMSGGVPLSPYHAVRSESSASVYVHLKLKDIEAINKPLQVTIFGTYTSYYKQRGAGIEPVTIKQTVSIKLVITGTRTILKEP
jgi:hypothetical protein